MAANSRNRIMRLIKNNSKPSRDFEASPDSLLGRLIVFTGFLCADYQAAMKPRFGFFVLLVLCGVCGSLTFKRQSVAARQPHLLQSASAHLNTNFHQAAG